MNQYTPTNPTTQYATQGFSKQHQKGAGLSQKMHPSPDIGVDTYQGSGRLIGKVAIITGGDSGIGAATALAFAREGADVAIVYLPEEHLDASDVEQLIKAEGRRCLTLPGDLRDEAFCQQVVDTTLNEFGRLDILVNNAGHQQALTDITKLETEQLKTTYETNIYAMFWLTRAAVPHLHEGGTIINTTSIQAYHPSAFLLDYASTKAAIANFTKGLAQQLAPKGIRVNAVAPGPVWTPLQVTGGQLPENLPEFGKETPLGRAGEPAELAPAYVFLASQESSYVTGAVIPVTGGLITD